VVQGRVSGPLRGTTLITIDPSLLDGGRAPDAELVRNRALLRLAALDVILFIDEAHRCFAPSTAE
jgi:ATP-dependent Clp protease ATP-binding subunit ClpA